MGDEQHGPPDPATPANRGTAEATGGDQVTLRPPAGSTTGEAEVGGDNDRQAEAAAQLAREGNRIDAGPAANQTDDDFTAGSDDAAEAVPEEAAPEEIVTRRRLTLDDIEMNAVRAIRYHEARARFFDLWRRIFDFLVVLLGAGAVSTFVGDSKFGIAILGITLAAIGALQLVAGFSEKAGDHTSLKRRFCGILADVTEARCEADGSDKRLAKVTKRWTAIWADEPSTMHVLDAIAHNAARRTLEWDLKEEDLIKISWLQSFTRNLSSWERFEPLTHAERAARKARKKRWWRR